MQKTLILSLFLFISLSTFCQNTLTSGNSFLRLHIHGDVELRNPDRDTGGRALVPQDNALILNYSNDFPNGVKIANQAHFKDHGVTIGSKVSDVNGEVNRLMITPYRHTGGPWAINSRDDSQAFLDFHYGPNKNLLTIQHQGNIGLGVAQPKNRLEVNGTIRAKEVKIEATGWADFVFNKDYQLPSLKEVESHINEYKHLPNIPTEAEVKENGISVGEIQAKLLQKIEELTLYMIEQNKKIEDQQKEVQSLKEENAIIKNKLFILGNK